MTHDAEKYEYQELIVGIAHRRSGPVSFRRTLSANGHQLDVGVKGNAMALLNEQGVLGWRVVRESDIVHQQHPWVVAELQDTDADVVSVSGSRKYLMARRLPD
ncbi:hypothetical protein [Gephyromycinifex aptenodytis]|uniref:hypothetical protein n=1 Tax=Gephyromycinifex aptenodytis TaxID=2716227 RepID=UPI001446C4A3|nr:hypothetical protein [Gephyromycinifex aptenodytis]